MTMGIRPNPTYQKTCDSRRVRLNRDKLPARATHHFSRDEALVPFVLSDRRAPVRAQTAVGLGRSRSVRASFERARRSDPGMVSPDAYTGLAGSKSLKE